MPTISASSAFVMNIPERITKSLLFFCWMVDSMGYGLLLYKVSFTFSGQHGVRKHVSGFPKQGVKVFVPGGIVTDQELLHGCRLRNGCRIAGRAVQCFPCF